MSVCVFIAEALRELLRHNYSVSNIDVTVLLEQPKLRGVKRRIAQNIAALLNTHVSNVNVKARTHEGVDAVGQQKAIACHALALLKKKPPND